MTVKPDILCIGSALWDIIGRTPLHMKLGADVPGRITRLPGGVAMNIAMALSRFGMHPALLSAVGRDAAGDDLIATSALLGVNCDYVYRSDDLPTDVYMAIECVNGLVAAIADVHSLEAVGDKILRPLSDGRLGTWTGLVALDGNLTTALLAEIAQSADLAHADLRIAPASPGKAERLIPLLHHPKATFYVNLEEAGILCQREFTDSEQAARGLLARGAARVLVTNGGDGATSARAGTDHVITVTPPPVMVTRVTGAGDTFMAAHIVAQHDGADDADALARAVAAAAHYVSGDTPL